MHSYMRHHLLNGSLYRNMISEALRSRFQLRILRDSGEMQDDESTRKPMDSQLILMNHVAPHEEADENFIQNRADGVQASKEVRRVSSTSF